jgi:hypothetical protein
MRYVFIFASCFVAFAVGGCVSGTTGNQGLTQDNVSEIQKGVTTRQDVVALLGEPDSTHLMADGRRMMFYEGGQMNTDDVGQSVWQAVPIVGVLVPSSNTNTTRRESLQIILNGKDVVEDYQFSDNTSEVKTTTSAFGGHVEQTTTSNVPPQ